MFTKFKRAFVAFLILSLAIVGCKNEEVAPSSIPTVSLKGTDCLKETPTVVKNFINGTSSDHEVAGFWDCAQTALTTFRMRVEGTDPRGYKSTELRRFLQINFLGGNAPDAIRINDELLKQLMQLKRLIVGGQNEWLTYQEVGQIIAVFSELKAITIELRPYMKILFKSKKQDLPDTEVMARAVQTFELAMLRLGEIVAKNNVAYSFRDLTSLLLELDRIYRERENGDDFARLAELVPLMSSVKAFLFSGVSERIQGHEWKGVFRLAGHVMSAVTRIRLYINSKSFEDPLLLNEVDRLGLSLFSVLQDAFSYRADQVIPNADMGKIVEEYAKQFPLPLNLTAEKAMELWEVLVDKVIPEYGTNVPGFSLSELGRVDAIFNEWLEVQFFLVGVDRPQLTRGVEEMKALLDSHPLPVDQNGRIVFSNDPHLKWDMATMTRMNLMRAGMGPVLQAFAVDTFRRANKIGLNKEEFEKAYAAIKPILVLLGIVKETDTTLGPRILQEADLFVPRSNGDFILNFFEIVEYAHLVLAGVQNGKLIVADLQQACAKASNPDPSSSVNADCFRKNYLKLFKTNYSNMPQMVSYLSGLQEKDWQKTLKGLEATNREGGASNNPVANSDIYEMGILMQYIEVIMQRYDVNQDGFLATSEGLAAFPLFKKVIADILGADPEEDEKDVRALFTYMLRYGSPPSPSDPISLIRFLNWKWSESKWKFSADRGVILKILSSLAES